MQIHRGSVRLPTVHMQGSFPGAAYAPNMSTPRDLATPNERIEWAIERAKAAGVPPEKLAAKVGLSRPGLLHWVNPATDISRVGVGPLLRFCHATHVNLEWLLEGVGLPDEAYTPTAEVAQLARVLTKLEQAEPAEYRVIARMIRSAATEDDFPKPPG